jgi:DNA-binding response OmpR family regulator
MDQHIDRQPCSQTLLIVNNSQEKLTPSCSILASFNQIYISILEAPTILPWIQQHQPDLIILDLEWFQVIDLQLITTLRLDWLTRSMPILVIANPSTSPLQSIAGLDYDAYLSKPYSPSALEAAICSLVSNSSEI